VRLEVFDVRGRRVETLVSGIRPAGRHEVEWQPRGARDGVYFVRLDAGGSIATRKLVRIR